MSGRGRAVGAGDDGAVLLIVLAFMAFMGMVIMAVLNFSDASFKLSAVTRDAEARGAAADGGIKFALAQLIANPAVCPDTTAETGPVAIGPAPEVNGFTPTVTCERKPVTVFTDSIGWGVYLTDAAGQIAASDDGVVGNERRVIDGPVYNHSTTAPWDLQANLTVRDGMVLQRITDQGCTTAQDIRLVLRGTASFACTPPVREPTPPVPTGALPTSPDLLASRSPDGDGGLTCRVFEAGRYAEQPHLVAQNYFRSGSYFFEQGLAPISGVDVLGGAKPPIEEAVVGALDSMPCRQPTDTTGVSFILGGSGQLVVGGGARVELHSNAKGDAAGTTIRQLGPEDPAVWQPYASTLAAAPGSEVVRAAGGASLVVHGLLWAPRGAVSLAGTGADVVQVRGGVVAARLALSATNDMVEPGVRIAAGESFSTEKFVLEAEVSGGDGRTVTITAVVRLPADDPSKPIIYSWTVE